jgi:hypothetical protein
MKSAPLCLLLLVSCFISQYARGAEPAAFHPVTCEGTYARHVQGICTNERDAIYWSWTDVLVKTDADGHVLKKVDVASHHGDLCYHDGRVYVAVNLGKFNEPAGKADSWVYVYDGDTLAELSRHAVPENADSWVYVYDGDTLAELSRHAVPELVHGAGGMAWHEGKFFVIGGLPPGVKENYIYEYDGDFKFVKRHVLASGYTLMGIQTVAVAGDTWWFGCYGKPKMLLRSDPSFKFTGKWEFDGSYGIVPLGDGKFLVGQNTGEKGKNNHGKLVPAHADATRGLVLDASTAKEK